MRVQKKNMSEGEITQLIKSKTLNINEKDYFKIINQKTASLFSSCCEMGSLSSGANKKNILLMREFGSLVGQAFQIRDDLMDILGNVDKMGKPSAFDLKKNIQTLPLIHIFNKLSKNETKKLKNKLHHHLKRSELNSIRQLITDEGGIEYAEGKIQEISNEAKDKLSIFPDSIYKAALLAVLSFNSERMK